MNSTLDYAAALKLVTDHLLHAIRAHRHTRFNDLEQIVDEVDLALPRIPDPSFGDLYIALEFMNSWVDSLNHNWATHPDIPCDDWPELAEAILVPLKAGQPIRDQRVLFNFGIKDSFEAPGQRTSQSYPESPPILTRAEQRIPGWLPDAAQDRVLLFLVSSAIGFASGGLIVGSLTLGFILPKTVAGYAVFECLSIVTGLCGLSMLWAVAKPRWIIRLLDTTAIKALFVVIIMATSSAIWIGLQFFGWF